MDFKKRFNMSADMVKNINNKNVTNEELGVLYGLYKQSIFGDCNIKEPSKIDLKAHIKFQHWNNNKGKSKDIAMEEYCNYVLKLVDKYGLKTNNKRT